MLETPRFRRPTPLKGGLLVVTALVLVLPGAMAPVSHSAPKAKLVTVTFHANGGTVGAKKSATRRVIQGKNLGKLPGARRVGYAFKGWYAKKTGGIKATGRTRVSRKTTFHAHWKRVLSAKEKELTGEWSSGPATAIDRSFKWIKFRADGTFIRNDAIPPAVSADYQHFWHNQGLWRVKGNRIIATEILESVEWHASNPARGYKNKRIADQSWTYFFDNQRSDGAWKEEGLTWLHINHYPASGGFDEYGNDYVKPTLVGQP